MKIISKKKKIIISILIIIIVAILFLFFNPSEPSPKKTSPEPDKTDFFDQLIYQNQKLTISSNLQISSFIPQVSLSSTNDLLIINHQSKIIKINSQEISIIHPEPVKNFSFNPPMVAFIEKQNPTRIFLLNLRTNQQQTINLPNISPIIDIALGPNNQKIYLLANLSTQNRTTSVYLLNNYQSSPKLIHTGQYTNIDLLLNNQLLLFSYADAPDASQIIVYNPNLDQITLTAKANKYSISPNLRYIASTNSNSLNILDTQTANKNSIPIQNSFHFYWQDNQKLVLLKNNFPGISQTIISPESKTISAFTILKNLEQKTIRQIIGKTKSHLLFTDKAGKLNIYQLL